MKALSPAQRTEIASNAARTRWGKKEPKKALKRARHSAARVSTPAVFGKALLAAESRFAEAIQERAYHANMMAALDAELPSLVQTIAALKNSQNPQVVTPAAWATTADASIAGAGSVPARRPPANRGGGMTLEANLATEEDEDAMLKDSAFAGGQWH